MFGSDVFNVLIVVLNIVLFIVLSVLMMVVFLVIEVGCFGVFWCLFGLMMFLGIVFLVIKGYEYCEKLSYGFGFEDSIFLVFYFGLIGVYVLYLFGGIVVNFV